MADIIALDERTTNLPEKAGAEVVASPFCRELRSKKYYLLQEMPTEEHQILDATNYCWCNLTMQAFGPDGERAHTRECKSDRPCYKSLFSLEP